MANVFVFTTSDHATLRPQISGDSLNRLDASLLIDRDGMNSLSAIQLDGIAVRLTDLENLCVPSLGIFDLREQPVLTSMRLNIGSILK
jgi:hypothetical protein